MKLSQLEEVALERAKQKKQIEPRASGPGREQIRTYPGRVVGIQCAYERTRRVVNPMSLHEACTTPVKYVRHPGKGGRLADSTYIRDLHTLTNPEIHAKWGFKDSTIRSDKSITKDEYAALCEGDTDE